MILLINDVVRLADDVAAAHDDDDVNVADLVGQGCNGRESIVD